MPPPVRTFPPENLPEEIQLDTSGRKRKPAPGAPRNIDLSACELFTMSQYECVVPRPDVPESRVQCYEVLRLFRKCADRKGTFMVETTGWEQQSSAPS
ncbi:hypothetical protein jhhlp_006041 [Lomentospora prolificans]|uniref:Uncharacterized protein n=1 Tax=Lomentospora prolificans TaxID=41688 RepID=A0A2N3N4T2_9PEZI|nr:hypothetical protein jhhlp_006041 [Lomentospora prolificans]